MAKHTAPAVKPRKRTLRSKRKLKRANKKQSKLTNLRKEKVVGMVNGFTVTRLEPEQLRLNRIFPESSDSPVQEPKRVTFAWSEETGQSDESRFHRANERRTHSARDSSADSLSEFDASREPKRRRTIESSIVEDAEARKATSSMRHSKPKLQHSTPAEAPERCGSSSKKVFPRTPKPADRTGTSANDTFEDTPSRDDEGEGSVDPKVSLASIFDGETNVDNGEYQVSGIEKCGERKSLNSDETAVELDAIDLPEVTPVRVGFGKVEEALRMDQTENESGAAVSARAGEVDCNPKTAVNAVGVVAEEVSRKSAENPQTNPASVSGKEANLTPAADPLKEASISRLSRRDSFVEPDNLEEDDVFKQRRSQIALDEEEPMEISVIQAASRLSKVPTPSPDHERGEDAVPKDIFPTAGTIQTAEVVESSGNADFATSAERDKAPGEDCAREVVENPTTNATSETAPKDASEQQPPTESDSTAVLKSDATQTEPSDSDHVCEATFEEAEDLELQALSCRIKTISERDETMTSPAGENPAGNEAESNKDSSSPSQADAVIKATRNSEGEPSSTLAIVSQGNSVALPKASSADEFLTFSAAVPSDQAHAMNGEENSVLSETVPSQQSSSVSDIPQTSEDALLPGTPETLPPRAVPPNPDAVLAEEGGASTGKDAGNSQQAESVSEVVQDHETNAQPKIETGENISAEKPDVGGNMKRESEAAGVADEPEPEGASTEQPETEDQAAENSNTEEPRIVELETEDLQPGKTTPEEAKTNDPITPDQLADLSKVDDSKIDKRKSSETGDDFVQLGQRDAGDTDIEKVFEKSDTVSNPKSGMETRKKRIRRVTQPFSPPTDTKETPTASKNKSTRSQKAITETPVVATPRTSRRMAAKASAKSATEEETETMPISTIERTPAVAKTEKTAASRSKTPKKSAAASKTRKAEVDESESPTETTEVPQTPKTPSRAAGSRKAGARTAKTRATSSKATTATPASKVAKSKKASPVEEASTSGLSLSEGSKSAVKSSKASNATTSRRKTTK